MRRIFVSYAPLDSSLRGGQKWWEEILQRIADSDVFVAVVSPQSLNSVACRRELEWASALDKLVLPLAARRRPQRPSPSQPRPAPEASPKGYSVWRRWA